MHRISLGVLASIFLAAAPASRAHDLSPAEKTLARTVEARLGEEMTALETVVNIDSGTFNAAGVREVGRFFDKELQALGFKTRWIPMPEAMHRGGHLVAERVSPKPSGKRVLLIGHLDTIFEGQGHRFERAGDVVRGAGVIDMKGGDVVILYALKALHAAGMLENTTVRVFMTGDEENPGLPTSESRRDVVAAANESDVALSFESGQGKIVLGRRGLSTWSLDVTGAQGHSATVFHKGGAGAIYETARILDGFQRAFSAHPSITLNTGLVLGGTDVAYDAGKSAGTSMGKFNVIAKAATAKGDLRFLSDADREQAKSKMLEIAATSLPKTSAKLTFDDMVPGWPATDGNRLVLDLVNAAARDLGQPTLEADDPSARGFGDVNFVGSLVAGIDGLGVSGEGFHAPDERMDAKTLVPATQRATVLIGRLLHPSK